ncbi:M48 family metallopeptidase [Cognatiluteimonas profundi]|uniref:M48 family metallopeptidase n=1 Tax=Cognatiluteimonas profundi TaxID=2594501 RepID=UPI00131BA0DE|nr:M48 family metallopeptidase [Lysobacter profundi]
MKPAFAILLAAVLAFGATVAHAAPIAPTTQATQAASTSPTAASFDVEANTARYMAQLSPQQRANSDAYFEGGYWLTLWDLLWVLGVAWLLLGTRLSTRMRDLAERMTRMRWLQTAIYAVQYILVTTLLTLPWSIYRDYLREHAYGLSTQNPGQWAGDQSRMLLVTLVLGTLALVGIYAVIRKATRSWWLWGAGAAIVFVMLVATIAPVYIAPLFNTYKSLPETPLKAQILSMARANQIPATDVYWFDASRQSKRISANVSGMFNTTRISLNDNLMNRSTPSEIKAVLGHEMGHYVLNHVYKGLLFFAVMIAFAFALVQWGFGKVERRWGQRWGIRGVDDVAGLPVLVSLLAIVMFFMTPLNNTMTRSAEAEADAFGLNAARQPDGFAQAAVQLSEYRKMHPGAVEEFVFFDHPSGWNRIHRSMVWKAEHIGDADIRAEDAALAAGGH